MKIFTIIARTLMGLLFLFASITFLFNLMTPPPLEGAMKTFNDGLMASIYIMPTVKVIELLCGLAFVSGFFVPLATVVITPIIVNIACIHTVLERSGMPVAIFLVVAWALLVFAHRDRFKPLLKA